MITSQGQTPSFAARSSAAGQRLQSKYNAQVTKTNKPSRQKAKFVPKTDAASLAQKEALEKRNNEEAKMPKGLSDLERLKWIRQQRDFQKAVQALGKIDLIG